MAINFTISYTFSPNTVIASAQVNTNFSDEANVWNGLEALTKTLAKLKVDVDPGTSLEVATKQYVDHYANFRRPVLQYSSGTVVNVEQTLTGTSGVTIQFPDGNVRTDSSSGRINCNLAQNAVLSGAAQSGLFTGSAVANTWYSFYAVKTSDNTLNFVTVALAINHVPANFTTLNTDFGTNSWVYLGCLPYGDNSGSTTAIPKFVMAGNQVSFYNTCVGNVRNCAGLRLNTSGASTGITFVYVSGTNLATPQIPSQFTIGSYLVGCSATTLLDVEDSSAAIFFFNIVTMTSTRCIFPVSNVPLTLGLKLTPSGSQALDIFLTQYVDGALGVGSNPMF